MTWTGEDLAGFRAAELIDRANGITSYQAAPAEPSGPELEPLRVVTMEEFAGVEEEGAAALVGHSDSILISAGGDVMVYGDGGAGKTTLSVDLAVHLASGADWLEMPVPQPVRVLLIENEGPRALFRKKLLRKLSGWKGAPPGGRVLVFEKPWAQITLSSEQWRAKLADTVVAHEIDVLIAGPLTRLGMDTAGTLQEVRQFTELVADVRRRATRLLTVCLIHHENKGGTVSGAWEGAGDTLLHVQAAGNGHTIVFVQKARWDSTRHGTTLKLEWADGDGFKLDSDRNLLSEVEALLGDGTWRTAKEIARPRDKEGVGANVDAVKALLDDHPERFENRSGDAAKVLGRSSKSTLWQRTQTPESVESVTDSQGVANGTDSRTPALRESVSRESPPSLLTGRTQPPESVTDDSARSEVER